MKSNFEIKESARLNLKANWGRLLLALFLFTVIESAATVIPVVGNLIVLGPLSVGLVGIYNKAAKGEEFTMWNLFDGFENKFGDAVLCSILRDIFTFLWSLLFIIPGIIKSYAYSMSDFLLYKEPELSGPDAIKKSIVLMRGNKARAFLLDLSFIGWGILVCLTFGILSIWVSPYHKQAKYMLFEEIYAHKDDARIAAEAADAAAVAAAAAAAEQAAISGTETEESPAE